MIVEIYRNSGRVDGIQMLVDGELVIRRSSEIWYIVADDGIELYKCQLNYKVRLEAAYQKWSEMLGLAATAWCKETTKDIEMDARLATEFAKILMKVYNE